MAIVSRVFSRALLLAGLWLAAPEPSSAYSVFINELHYDNAGGDVAEQVELAASAGLDLTGWRVLMYNGGNGEVYREHDLAGTVPDQGNGFGVLAFDITGAQNGGPDGLALVDDGGGVVQFLSYEGVLTAADGPAVGLSSQDIGVAEDGSTLAGYSLQLEGFGDQASDFTWIGPSPASFGLPNAGQVLVAPLPSAAVLLLSTWLTVALRRRPGYRESRAAGAA